ncbi:MAG: restriction endonuclease, partial [Gammaproteobacteria bacterium]|nr:restriction endonuclease [Gammaproteobacteria bacterium]
MPVPDFQSLMLPTLKSLGGGGERSVSQIREQVAADEGISALEVREMLPSGRQYVFANRVAWALSHMGRAGLLERVRKGVYRSTQEGESLLSREPSRIDMKLLGEYPEYREWRQREKGSTASIDATSSPGESSSDTPEEALERAIRQLRIGLEAEVLQRV